MINICKYKFHSTIGQKLPPDKNLLQRFTCVHIDHTVGIGGGDKSVL